MTRLPWHGDPSRLPSVGSFAYDPDFGWGVRVLPQDEYFSCGEECCGIAAHACVVAESLQFAIVFGWGAVEATALAWHPDAVCAEVQPRLWRVECHGVLIGMIGKEPWHLTGLRLEVEKLAGVNP